MELGLLRMAQRFVLLCTLFAGCGCAMRNNSTDEGHRVYTGPSDDDGETSEASDMNAVWNCDTSVELQRGNDDASVFDAGADAGADASDFETATLAGNEWTETFLPTEDTPDMQPAVTSLFVPPCVRVVRAVLVFSDNGKGYAEYEAEEWRSSARKNEYAIMRVQLRSLDSGESAAVRFPEQAAYFLVRILEQSAARSGHAEIADGPIVFWGHSAGGQMGFPLIATLSDRVAGFVGFKGMARRTGGEGTSLVFEEELLRETTLEIPVLGILADHDAENIKNGSFLIVEKGRQLGARWGLAFEIGGSHNAVGTTHAITIPFVEEVIRLRIPKSVDVHAGPVALNALPETSGYLGMVEKHLEFTEGDGRSLIVLDSLSAKPFTNDISNPEAAYWLISETFADRWVTYQSVATQSDDD